MLLDQLSFYGFFFLQSCTEGVDHDASSMYSRCVYVFVSILCVNLGVCDRNVCCDQRVAIAANSLVELYIAARCLRALRKKKT